MTIFWLSSKRSASSCALNPGAVTDSVWSASSLPTVSSAPVTGLPSTSIAAAFGSTENFSVIVAGAGGAGGAATVSVGGAGGGSTATGGGVGAGTGSEVSSGFVSCLDCIAMNAAAPPPTSRMPATTNGTIDFFFGAAGVIPLGASSVGSVPVSGVAAGFVPNPDRSGSCAGRE